MSDVLKDTGNSGTIVPDRDSRDDVVRVEPVVDFLPRQPGKGSFRVLPAADSLLRLAPLPFTGRGWKQRSSSQRRTWCLEKRMVRRIRFFPRFSSSYGSERAKKILRSNVTPRESSRRVQMTPSDPLGRK